MEATLDAPIVLTTCRHCGDPCAGGGVRSSHGRFCCDGCATVFALLADRGLDDYYACDVAPGVSQRTAGPREADRFAALDDPAVAERVLGGAPPDGTGPGALACAVFDVPSLHCASCVWLLERLWQVDDGIVRAEADLLRRTVQVWFRRDHLSLRAVAERLASIGYEPEIAGETRQGAATPARRRLYVQLGLAGFAAGNMMIFSIPRYANGAPLEPTFQALFDALNLVLATPVLIVSAGDWLRGAWRALAAGRLTLDVPVALGLLALYARSVAEIATGAGPGFLDAFAGLVFFLLIGRLFQQKAFDRIAFDRTWRSFLPLTVRVAAGDGVWQATPLDDVRPGDRVLLRPQEVVPADARLLDATGTIDYAFVTGETSPVIVGDGELVRAGGRVVGRALRLVIVAEIHHTELARLWRHPAFTRATQPWLTDVAGRFGAWFTAATLLLAVAGAAAWWPDAAMAAQVASAVLIIACPCALTLAAPVTLGTAMGILGRAGLYVKQPAVVLDLSRVDTIVFDKTGTLTAGARLAEPVDLTPYEWRLARRLAAESAHPISRAIAGDTVVDGTVGETIETPGAGILGTVDHRTVAIGTPAFVAALTGRPVPAVTGTAVAIDGRLRGWARLAAPARRGIESALARLSCTTTVWLLSGDDGADADDWAPFFGGRVRFRQSPDDKLAFVEARRRAGARVLMIGDGLNDAGALAAADAGLAVSDDTACLVPACDAVIGGDAVPRLPALLAIARRARQVIVLCFAVSVVYNVLGLGLALTGRLTPLATAVLMPVSSLTVIGLAAGAMRWIGRKAVAG